MKKNLLYLLVVVFVSGCFGKDAKDEDPEPEKVCYLQKVETTEHNTNGTTRSTVEYYTYNSQNRLIEKDKYEKGEFQYGSTFEYDAAGRITRENIMLKEGIIDSYYDNMYDNEGKVTDYTLSWDSFTSAGFVLFSRVECDYSSARQITALRQYIQRDGIETFNGVTQFTYTGGLMTRSLRLDKANQKVRETILTYDNKKHPWSALQAYWVQQIAEGFPHEHNFMSKAVTDAAGNPIANESFSQTATYTPEGYLASYSRTYADGRTEQAVYTYACK